jgi:hypothetical protein
MWHFGTNFGSKWWGFWPILEPFWDVLAGFSTVFLV